MRRLVVTADDLGRDPATTDVVLGLVADGCVTATTLIPVAPESARAAARARELGVTPRLHLTLTGERGLPPWRPLAVGGHLAGPDGALAEDPLVLGARGDEDVAADVVEELDAQLAWMRGQGLAPTAADSHGGTLYGLHGRSWLAETLAWCGRHGLAFRLPRDPVPYLGGPVPAELANLHARAVGLADALGVALPEVIMTNRLTAAQLGSYEALLADLVARLDTLPEGTSELFLHPSTADAALDGAVRAWEARLLRDPAWHAAVAASGVELVDGWAA
jgi:predicted glycoside hydrolase/deacetylase ChbG (UPF0249 family)